MVCRGDPTLLCVPPGLSVGSGLKPEGSPNLRRENSRSFSRPQCRERIETFVVRLHCRLEALEFLPASVSGAD